MMANRSYRRLPHPAIQAYEAANLKRQRRADSIRARGCVRRPIKRPDICEQPDLQHQQTALRRGWVLYVAAAGALPAGIDKWSLTSLQQRL